MDPICLLDGNRGIYLPQEFARNFDRSEWNLAAPKFDSAWEILEEGPDHTDYWEAWDEILTDATRIIDGVRYSLEQDNDLFAIPEENS